MRARIFLWCSLLAVSPLVACGSDSGAPAVAFAPPDLQDSGPASVDAGGGSLPEVDSGGAMDDSKPRGKDAGKGSDSAPVDAGPFTTAAHPPFPLLVRGSASGGVLSAPVIVPVFFPGYDHTTEVKDQLSTMGTVGTYWHDAVSEYGVGAFTYGTPVDLTEAAPASIGHTGIVTWLKGKLSGSHPGFPTPTAQTMYVLYYPSTTNLQGSCSDPATGGGGYGGYHDALQTSGGTTVAYGVIAECANFGSVPSTLDMVTVAGSHEIIEAVTDAQPGNGFASLDARGFALDIFLQGNEENGDLCAVSHAFLRPASYPYLLSRGWSNKAAAAGNQDPCQPALPDQPYIGAAPVMPDTISAAGSSGPGIVIPIGQSKTVDVELWSSGPTAPFTVAAKQARGDTTLSFSWDKTTGVNGDHLKLTITANSTKAGGYETFVIVSKLNDEQRPIWAGVVKN